MADIRALGRLPRSTPPGLGEEYKLGYRLREAKRQRLLSPSQLAELAELPSAAEMRAAERVATLMPDIRALGHVPRTTPGLQEENTLARRLREAKRKRVLSESQLAELAELPRVGRCVRQNPRPP